VQLLLCNPGGTFIIKKLLNIIKKLLVGLVGGFSDCFLVLIRYNTQHYRSA
jgi:hypothetical protein